MRLQREVVLLILMLGCAAQARPGDAPPGSPGASPPSGAPVGSYLSRAEIHAAAAKLRADPNLGGEKTVRTLRWNEQQEARLSTAPMWLTGLVDFLAQSLSVLLWIVGAIAAAIAVVWLTRLLRRRVPGVATIEPRVISVRGLDIRPESLPPDIGAAALELLDKAGEREALSLLYRGALSCAVHRHHIAIGASTTEGEALRAVNATLDPGGAAYFADLVGLWQRVVYAHERVMREPIARLCSGFRASLEGAPA